MQAPTHEAPAHAIQALQTRIRDATRLRPYGAGTKSETTGELRAPSGVIEYQPTEFIVHAYAGTPIKDLIALLDAQQQYLPFDPLLAEAGATVGGTVACNASGSERYRYGGVRDFIVGCGYIDGTGERLMGGGKVVKNAAGFDYPKLFVGSRGTLAFLIDVVFKVFPKPETYNTLIAPFGTLADANAAMLKLASAPYDIHALDLVPNNETAGAKLIVRVGGLQDGIAGRMQRVRSAVASGEIITAGADEAAIWREMRELAWARSGDSVLKVPVTPAKLVGLDAALATAAASPEAVRRRYGVAGNTAWIALAPEAIDTVSNVCAQHGLSGVVFRGPRAGLPIGAPAPENVFAQRVKQALDPSNIFS
jgi:glycolate oxidase FAD binding subunit